MASIEQKVQKYLENIRFFCIFALTIIKNTILTMTSVNKVIVVGNVGSDPDVRTLERGGIIVSLNLATTERGYTMQNGIRCPVAPSGTPLCCATILQIGQSAVSEKG